MAFPENETEDEYFQRRAREEQLLNEENLASIEAMAIPSFLKKLLEAGELTQEEADEILAQLDEPETEIA